MYKIGEFSKITNLTTKALRYYDEQEILAPSYRAENEYRYYSESDFEKARVIVQLKSLGFSIAEMKEVFENGHQTEDIPYYLSEKKAFIEKQIEEEKALIQKIEEHLLPKNKEVVKMEYQIVEKKLEPVSVVSIRYRGKYSEVGDYIGKLYKEAKNNACGAPFNCYYEEEFKEEADIELCVPTKGLVKISDSSIMSKQLPAIKGISTIHVGSYKTLNFAYKALMDYAKEHGIEIKLPSREIYLKGPGIIFKGNSEKYETEIILPFE